MTSGSSCVNIPLYKELNVNYLQDGVFVWIKIAWCILMDEVDLILRLKEIRRTASTLAEMNP